MVFTIDSVTSGNANVTVVLTDIGDVPNALGYMIYYSSTDTDDSEVFTKDTFTLSTTISNLTNGVAYTFQATKTSSSGMSTDSNILTSTPYTIPGTVSGLINVMDNNYNGLDGGKEIILSWDSTSNPLTNNGGNAIVSYILNVSDIDSYLITNRTILVSSLTNSPSDTFSYVISDANLDIGANPLLFGVTYTATLKATNARNNSATAATTSILKLAVPNAPTHFAASINALTVTSVDLTWDAHNAETNGGSEITFYTVRYSNDDTTWTTYSATVIIGTTITLTGLTTPIASYTFKISATNSTGTSAESSTTIVPDSIPNDVTGLVATNTNLGVTLTWECVDDDETSPLIGYVIYYKIGAIIHTEHVAEKTVTFSNFALGTSITFRVRALNMLGQSVLTASASIIIKSVPTLVQSFTATGTAHDGFVELNWLPPLNNGGSVITGYSIYSSATYDYTNVGIVNTYNVTGLTNGTSYDFMVAAINAIGESQYVDAITATPIIIPTLDVITLTANGNGNDSFVRLTWTTPTNTGGSAITGYKIYNVTGTPGFYVYTIATDVGTDGVVGVVNAVDVTGLTNGTSYKYAIVAINIVGDSGYSNVVTGTPKIVPRWAGNELTGTGVEHNNSAVLNWTTPIDNGGSNIIDYRIHRVNANGSYTIITSSVVGNTSTVTGLVNGTTYNYVITASNSVGRSLYSNTVTVKPSIAPSWVNSTVTATTALNNAVTLSWNNVSINGSATELNIYFMITEDGGLTYSPCAIVTSDTDSTPINYYGANTVTLTEFYANYNSANTLFTVTNGTSYSFLLQAFNESGSTNTPISNFATPSSDPGIPISPSVVAANINGVGSAVVTWSPPVNTGGIAFTYKISLYSGVYGVGTPTIVGIENTVDSIETLIYTFANIAISTDYFVKLYAYNGINANNPDTTFIYNFNIPLGDPSAPINVAYNYVISNNTTVLNVTWDEPLTVYGTVQYNIKFYDGLGSIGTPVSELITTVNGVAQKYYVYNVSNVPANYSIKLYAYNTLLSHSPEVYLNVPSQALQTLIDAADAAAALIAEQQAAAQAAADLLAAQQAAQLAAQQAADDLLAAQLAAQQAAALALEVSQSAPINVAYAYTILNNVVTLRVTWDKSSVDTGQYLYNIRLFNGLNATGLLVNEIIRNTIQYTEYTVSNIPADFSVKLYAYNPQLLRSPEISLNIPASALQTVLTAYAAAEKAAALAAAKLAYDNAAPEDKLAALMVLLSLL